MWYNKDVAEVAWVLVCATPEFGRKRRQPLTLRCGVRLLRKTNSKRIGPAGKRQYLFYTILNILRNPFYKIITGELCKNTTLRFVKKILQTRRYNCNPL